MNADANQFWDALARKVAQSQGHGYLTPQEAQAEYDRAPAEPLTDDEVEATVEAVLRGECQPGVESDIEWSDSQETLEPVLCLNRNPGKAAPAPESGLEEHRRKALNLDTELGAQNSWKTIEAKLRFARQLAAQVLDILNTTKLPVDPAWIAQSEAPRLRVVADDFGTQFDGQLEYHAAQKTFLLFVNNKYDSMGAPERTRFSLAHELGHYFLDHHRAYLMSGGSAHASQSEFVKDAIVEREADAFAASLLLPERLFAPLINDDELTLDRIESLAIDCNMSRVCTAIRAVEVSHFPCSVAGIRDGKVAWQFVSGSLIEGGCYPGPKGTVRSESAAERWTAFRSGDFGRCVRNQFAKSWFRTYERVEKERLPVKEFFLPVQRMETLVVLLTVPESELFPDTGDD